MNITIRINTDSTTFEGRTASELCTILKTYAIDTVYMAEDAETIISRPLHDSNGQVCGSVEVQESEV